ncbi:MAG: DUF192 domain-containing protein [Candidatus Nanoarchaeia archaeon]|nr:DUF192 domain-containing protein [Candidatus Nanoarchaeia archaeon]MDD5239504.1 DUF192 domain-containing protein [Candidatus Nanoarchaeia archaeon]
MKVKLRKGNKVIASSVSYLDTPLKRGIGMMFKKTGAVVLVAGREGIAETAIHTFFCVPLFVAWISSRNIVINSKKTKPCHFYASPKPAKYVFETTNLKMNLKAGDKVSFTKG